MTRTDYFSLGAILLLVVLIMLAVQTIAVTGDEPRYILFAASIWEYGTLVMPAAEWVQHSSAWLGYQMDALPALGDGAILGHPIYVTALLSPFAEFGSAGLRATGLLAGLFGLAALYIAMRHIAGSIPASIATVCAGLLFPLVPYLHTFWAEVFIFAGIAAGLMQLPRAGESRASDLWRGAIILIIPFIHLRGAVIGTAIFLAFFLRVYHSAGFDTRRLAPLAILASGFALLLIGLNVLVYGSPIGSVTTARPPSLFELYDVVATNLVTVKGLLPYAPIWILGYAGLVAGAARRERLATEGGVFAGLALLTSIGINPGEGAPGRFLIASAPMLAIGLAYWLSRSTNRWQWLLTTVLMALSLAHTVVFVARPNLHLENRQSDVVFQYLYDQIGLFNFGLFAPVEGIDTGLARVFLLIVGVMIALAAASVIFNRRRFSVAGFLLALALVEMTRATEIPVQPSVDSGILSAALPTSPKQVSIAFGKPWERWYAPPYPLITSTTLIDGGFREQDTRPANPIFSEECHRGISAMALQSSDFDIAAAAEFRLRAFETASVLTRSYIGFMQICD